ncbi:hypothetical protein ACJROX_24865 [Pseudalkalibacillus sp. A8]|uniref:hypothetical protein n=1 Tax=Pseudalkalibacillus sp. A8 TaxID=3382641 RepID=UPI0038B50851
MELNIQIGTPQISSAVADLWVNSDKRKTVSTLTQIYQLVNTFTDLIKEKGVVGTTLDGTVFKEYNNLY